MPGDLIIHLKLEDEPLLHTTAREYAEAIQRGEMTDEEAEQNFEALVFGMIVLE